jgi:hypothetical protein
MKITDGSTKDIQKIKEDSIPKVKNDKDVEKQIINFEAIQIPQLQVIKSYDKEYYLADKNNSWFNDLLKLYFESSIHSAIIDNLSLKINKQNLSGSTDILFSKITLDFLIFGGFALEVVWNLSHDRILKLNHLDFSKVRAQIVDSETGQVEHYLWSNDWFRYNNKQMDCLQTYSDERDSDQHQIYYYKRYSPQAEIYPKPYYYSALKWVYTDIELETYYANLVKHNFVGNTILSINSFMDQDKQKDFENAIKKNFTGSENAGSIIVMYSESKENAPEILRFNSEDDTKYQYLTTKVIEQISIGHQLPIALLGILVPGQLGNATDIPIYNEIYNETMVIPLYKELMAGYLPIKNNYML